MLVNIRFQVLFHSPPGVLFTFPSQYFCAIGHQVVFRLGEWSPRLLTGFHVSADTLDPARFLPLRLRVSHTLWMAFPKPFGSCPSSFMQSKTPFCISTGGLASSAFARHYSRNHVVFSSSGYLDVSLPRVPFLQLWIHCRIHGSSPWGLPHSDICGSIAYLQLTAAFRSLSRPSSAPDAKVFTLCSL